MEDINQYSQKKAYSYDKSTGEYTGIVWADPCPKNAGQYLLPAFATFTPLDDAEAGYAVVYKGDEKQYFVDKRGTEYWQEDGTKHVIAALGEEVPEGAFLEEPVVPPTQAEQESVARQQCTTRIEAKWSQVGQSNALFGVYGEAAKLECGQWIAAHRSALTALLAREDFTEIDVTEDEYWPTSIESIRAELASKKTGLFRRLKKNSQATSA